MDQFVTRTPRTTTIHALSMTNQDMLDPNTFDDPALEFDIIESLLNAFELSANRKRIYHKLLVSERKKIGKYAAENTVERAMQLFGNSDNCLKLQSVYNWKQQYLNSIKTGAFSASTSSGRLLILGDMIDAKVIERINRLRNEDAVVSTSIVLSVARAYLIKLDNSRYKFEGEQILTRALGRSILDRMQYIKRKATKAAKKITDQFQ